MVDIIRIEQGVGPGGQTPDEIDEEHSMVVASWG